MRVKPEKVGTHYTIKSLKLDVDIAQNHGKTWLLLPEGWRDQEGGLDYPLPSRRMELQILAGIYIPPHQVKRDSGCMYLRRAVEKWKESQMKANSAILDVARRSGRVERAQQRFMLHVKQTREKGRAESRKAVEDVRKEAVRQIASLTDLFALGREGLENQMRAHLRGRKWKGEKITAAAFRDCFRMTTQAVKGLGLPSDQRVPAAEAVMEEVAASIKQIQETISLAPSTSAKTDESRN